MIFIKINPMFYMQRMLCCLNGKFVVLILLLSIQSAALIEITGAKCNNRRFKNITNRKFVDESVLILLIESKKREMSRIKKILEKKMKLDYLKSYIKIADGVFETVLDIECEFDSNKYRKRKLTYIHRDLCHIFSMQLYITDKIFFLGLYEKISRNYEIIEINFIKIKPLLGFREANLVKSIKKQQRNIKITKTRFINKNSQKSAYNLSMLIKNPSKKDLFNIYKSEYRYYLYDLKTKLEIIELQKEIFTLLKNKFLHREVFLDDDFDIIIGFFINGNFKCKLFNNFFFKNGIRGKLLEELAEMFKNLNTINDQISSVEIAKEIYKRMRI